MNIRQEMFVREYLVDLCGAKAARRAGYSERSAKERAYRLLRDPEIKRAVDAAMEERLKRIEVKQDEVIRELKAVAMAQASDENGGEAGQQIAGPGIAGKASGDLRGEERYGLGQGGDQGGCVEWTIGERVITFPRGEGGCP